MACLKKDEKKNSDPSATNRITLINNLGPVLLLQTYQCSHYSDSLDVVLRLTNNCANSAKFAVYIIKGV